MPKKIITLTRERKDIYKGILLLDEMINKHKVFPLIGTASDKTLEPLLVTLLSKNLIMINGNEYIPTQAGRENLLLFYKRYWESVRIFQVYTAVDLVNGTFAYSKYWDMSEQEFGDYLNDELIAWEDVRIAVAEFKKIDPIEIVFMSFLSEGRFNFDQPGWQLDLMSDMIWDEIVDICSTAIHMEDLMEDDAIKNIVILGSKLMVELLKKEDELKKDAEKYESQEIQEIVNIQQVYYVDEIVEEDYDYTYYESYYNPYYVSPIWLLLLI
jgi:hypothetical protein